jgi:hypothetical protein
MAATMRTFLQAKHLVYARAATKIAGIITDLTVSRTVSAEGQLAAETGSSRRAVSTATVTSTAATEAPFWFVRR